MLNRRGSQIEHVHTCPPDLKVPFDVTCAADVNVTTGCTEATCCLTSDESSPSSLGQKLADTEIDCKT